MRNIAMKEKAIIGKKKHCYLCESDEHLVKNCPFNLKTPHSNIKHITD